MTEGEEGAPKTTNSRRTIPLLPPVVDYLKRIKPPRAKPEEIKPELTQLFMLVRGAGLEPARRFRH